MGVTMISSPSPVMSRLNPNAPIFVPGAYRAVEDFSEEWWSLVHSSPWFRDYWLHERYLDPSSCLDDLVSLPDSLDADDDDFDYEWCSFDCYSDAYPPHREEEEEEHKKKNKELAKVGSMRWQDGRGLAQLPRYTEKAPKLMKVKVSPRRIQQPK